MTTPKPIFHQYFDAVLSVEGEITTMSWPDVTASRGEDGRWSLTFLADNGADAIGKIHEVTQRGAKIAPDKYKLLSLRSQLTGVIDDVPLTLPNPDVRVKRKRLKDATVEMFAPAEVERQQREGAVSRENEAWR